MLVICDTNIWYGIDSGRITLEHTDNVELVGVYNSIDELSSSPRLLSRPELVAGALRSLMKSSSKLIYEPPLVFIYSLLNNEYVYSLGEIANILEATQRIANGEVVEEDKREQFRGYISKVNLKFENFSAELNREAQKIKTRLKQANKNNSEETINSTRNFIKFMVNEAFPFDNNWNNFDWKKVDLFEQVLKQTFHLLVKGSIEMKANDVFDLFNLIYVHPNQKYWTEDGKWKKIIEAAGRGDVLFDDSKIISR